MASEPPPEHDREPPSDTPSSPSGLVDAGIPPELLNPIGTALPDPGLTPDPSPTPAPGTATPPPSSAAPQTPGNQQESCIPTSFARAERKRLDMYIVMDANITLPYSGLWEFMTTGLRAFVRDPLSEGIGVGLRYYGADCEPEGYDTNPTVEVGTLPGNADRLLRALSVPVSYSASPMAPALEGGIAHQAARARSKEHSGAKQVVVIATDGITQDLTFSCRYSTQDLRNLAADGFNATTPIETHVLGFGIPDTMNEIADDVLARFSSLDSIAESGGTRKSIALKTGQDSEVVHDAMSSVRRLAQPCEYIVPEDSDPESLNLTLIGVGSVPLVDNAASCGRTDGYFLEEQSDEGTQRMLMLCPASCALLQQNDYQAWLLGGCPPLRRR